MPNQTSGNEKDIWGKVVLYLKENRHIALHIACGALTDVKIEGDSLVIETPDTTTFTLLTDGKREIEKALSWQGKELRVVVKEKAKQVGKFDQDEIKLTKIFGNKFKKGE